MIHLVCSCQCESWSWTVLDPNPIALAFRQSHERRGHTVKQRAERKPKAAA